MKEYTAKQLKELYKSPKYFLECLRAETLSDAEIIEVMRKYTETEVKNAKRKA